MSEQDFSKLIGENIKKYMELNNLTQTDIANKLNVSTSSVSQWVNAKKSPRMDKVDDLCKIFGITRKDLLIEGENKDDYYYINNETREIANDIYHNPELRMLFDASRDLSPEDIKATVEMIEILKKRGS